MLHNHPTVGGMDKPMKLKEYSLITMTIQRLMKDGSMKAFDINGWWTGYKFDGLQLKRSDDVIAWRRCDERFN